MEKDFKTEKAYDDFAKSVGNPYGLEKKREVVEKILKDNHVDNLSRAAGYKQAEVIKKIVGITDLGYKTRKAVSAFGKKEIAPIKPKVYSKKTYDEIVGKGKKTELQQKKDAGRVHSNVLHFGISNGNIRKNEELIYGTNKQIINKNNHRVAESGGEKRDSIKNKLREIQS